MKSLSKAILVIGAGRMGYGEIKTLLSKGHTVYVNDPSVGAVDKSVNLGAIKTHDISEVTSTIDCVILSLPSPSIVKDTATKIKNAAGGNEFSVIDLSTIDPQTAKDSYELLKTVGVSYIEAPVSGGPTGAESGTLSIMVGGAEDDYLKVLPLLEQIGKNIFYLGEVGS